VERRDGKIKLKKKYIFGKYVVSMGDGLNRLRIVSIAGFVINDIEPSGFGMNRFTL
jgi:hypothetical protein